MTVDKPRSDEKQKLTHDAYTVGWICVLRCELNASRALLDEEHEPLPPVEKDDNSYLLGRIAGHNVAIAFTGSGTYGTNAAAQTATHMIRTFRNIRFGLMVGVGGGAPKPPDPNDSLNDICLGDVVVGSAKGSHGGVLQYDMGKWKDDGEFRIDSHLSKPPKILSKAIELLQSHHDFGDGEMTHYIKEVAAKSTKLRALRDYRFPGRDQDQLFRAGYPHVGDDDCSICDATQLEKRLTRESDDPAVHYGLIASGNSVMRSAQRRDELRDAWGVLCFEMEAAGLMDEFPCVVIRGICDYSDNHKHKIWQPYSAVAAAAYAKDLLRVIQPREVEGMETAAKMIAQFFQTVVTTGETATRIESKLVRHEDIGILNWLTPIDYGPQHSDLLRRRQLGTGQWLLGSEEYQAWLKNRKQTLFCPGIPGAGKTILTSIVIDNIMAKFRNDSTTGIAFVYCNFQRRDDQKFDDLLASLLKQLAEGCLSLPQDVRDLYGYHSSRRTRPSVEEISSTLHCVVAKYSRVFIIIDALDECSAADCCRTRLLSELSNLQERCGINIWATSRFIPEIIDHFKGNSESLEIRASRADVESYLVGHMSRLRSFVQQNAELQEQIKTGISEAVDGMFLLAQIYLDLLDDKVTLNDIRSALHVFQKQGRGSGEEEKTEVLAHAYKQAMERINGQKPALRKLAMTVLSWITCTKRQLTTSELQHALAIRVGQPELDRGDLPYIGDMVSVCAGLVTIDKDSDVIRLVHYTTQDFLQRTQKDWFPDAETDITKVCITYLSFDLFEAGFCQTDRAFEERLRSNPLYDYVARNWGHHAHAASARTDTEMDPELKQLALDFLESEAKTSAACQAMMVVDKRVHYSQILPREMTGLHLTAYFDLKELMVGLLEKGHIAHGRDTRGRSPLLLAAENGSEALVELLMAQKGVDLKSKDGEYGQTPLARAAENGHKAVVKLLLQGSGINPDQTDYDYHTPLSRAAMNGHTAVVKLLLEKDSVDVDFKGNLSRSPLSWAAKGGHVEVVKLLLEKDAQIESKCMFGRTPLSYARTEAVVELLLEKGAELESRDVYGQTPLSWAIVDKKEAVVKLLVKKNANLEIRDKGSRTLLSHAAASGHRGIVEMLIDNGGIDLRAEDQNGLTALFFAVLAGHEAIVRLLLEKAGANSTNTRSRLLLCAAEYRHEAILSLLLDGDGIDINVNKNDGRTPLYMASRNGDEAIVKLLLNCSDIDVNAKDRYGRTSLYLAAEEGNEAIIKLLLDTGK
ncbi:ankyrin repeat-containing domain protein, partial [Thelonectria olida]